MGSLIIPAMKILQMITRGDDFYGAQSHVLNLSERLLADGHSVKVVVGSTGRLTNFLEAKGIEYVHVPTLKRPMSPVTDIKGVLALRKVIKDYKPDLVATHSSKAGLLGRVAAWSCRTPNFFTAHGWSFEEGIPVVRRNIGLVLEKIAGRISSHIIAVAHSERQFGLDNGVCPPSKMSTVHYGVLDSVGQLLERAEEVERVELVMVAGFRPQKDHETLLRALQNLPDLNWHLSLLGDGELESEIQSLAAELQIADKVTFTGAVDDVGKYLTKADVLVLTTHWEGLPISTLEGLSYSLPVIATDVAGTKEQVIDNYNGITLPRSDVKAASDALRLLIENGQLRVKYGKNSRELFEENFTLDRCYQKTLALYERVLSDAGFSFDKPTVSNKTKATPHNNTTNTTESKLTKEDETNA